MVSPVVIWRLRPWHYALALAFAAFASILFWGGLKEMVLRWSEEEYSHGYMLPFVVVFLVWQRSSELRQTPFSGSYWGVLWTALGLFSLYIGAIGGLYTFLQYGFVLSVGGALLSLMGWRAFRVILPAYLLLFFMVPLPNFLYKNLSLELQFISSWLGSGLIRLVGIPVFLDGNIIDLGSYKLQVAEACSGLRYLFPLTALGYIAAVIFKGPLWKKAVIFLATIPITVLMNSFRVGAIGVLVEHGGIKQAEGFLHDFEGWVVFMACAGLLVGVMAALAKVGKQPMRLRDAFALEGPAPIPTERTVLFRRIPVTFFVSGAMVASAFVISQMLPMRMSVVPERADLIFFPSTIGEWRGKPLRIDEMFLDVLQLDDYLLSDYSANAQDSVNLYVAYYGTQRRGASVHSPRTCLPAGGWRIQEIAERDLTDVSISGQPLRVNRALIRMGNEQQLVYYWLQQRGRVMTDEKHVMWYLFWDAVTRNRTDGALIRLATRVQPGDDIADADALLTDFAKSIAGQLPRFIPD